MPAAALLLLNGTDPLGADADGSTPADAAAAAGAAPDALLIALLRTAANKAQAWAACPSAGRRPIYLPPLPEAPSPKAAVEFG